MLKIKELIEKRLGKNSKSHVIIEIVATIDITYDYINHNSIYRANLNRW
ncbi:hypothetical protein [Anaeromicrobium sp.]|nr:hypothetical protein [Anaeromicrobium sp.]